MSDALQTPPLKSMLAASQPSRDLVRTLVIGASLLAIIAGATAPRFARGETVPQSPAPVSATMMATPDFATLVARVKPAVVSVQVKIDGALASAEFDGGQQQTPNPFGDGENPFKGSPFEHFFDQFKGMPQHQGQGNGATPKRFAQAVGSGFFISADGYAVTNNHVVEHAVSVEIVTDDGTTHKARVIGTDPKTDLALIKVDGKTDFPFVKLASAKPRIGEWVLAVGNPFGLGGTVTAGIVSAQGRDIGAGPYDDFIQIDASVNKGNSGGPTFNLAGEVVGVNTMIFSPSGGSVGIAFDVPASTVSAVIPVLRDKGHIERAWLGVQIQNVTTEIADSLNLKEAKGALVSEPQADGPAAKAGLTAGDVIVKVDGAAVADSHDLARRIGGMAPNSKVALTIWRDGAEQKIELSLGLMKDKPTQVRADATEEGAEIGKLGLAVAPAKDVDGPGMAGLVVTSVAADGLAASVGIQTGDVILKAGRSALANPSDLSQALADSAKQGKKTTLALVKHGDEQHYVALPSVT